MVIGIDIFKVLNVIYMVVYFTFELLTKHWVRFYSFLLKFYDDLIN